MSKRTVCLLLAVILMLGLFSGCNMQMTMLPQNTKPASTKPTESNDATEATDPTQSTGENQTNQSVDLGQPKEDPVRPATMPAEVPNLEKGVYASCGNYYYTIYMTPPPDPSNDQIKFYLMTENPLPDDAEIVTGLQAKHRVTILDHTPSIFQMDQQLYAEWKGAGVDWAKLYQLERRFYATQVECLAGKVPYADIKTAYQPYADYYNPIIKESGANAPGFVYQESPFYYYTVQISLSHYFSDEALTEVQLVAGDMSRTIPIGEIRLRKRADPSTTELNLRALTTKLSLGIQEKIPSFTSTLSRTMNALREPWSTGVQSLGMTAIAREDITLTDVYFFANGGENCKIIGAEVLIVKTDGFHQILGEPIEVSWKPGTPLQIRKDELYRVQIYYEDPWSRMAEYCAKHYIILEYTLGEKVGRVLVTNSSAVRQWSRKGNQYLWVFTDVDVKDYYEEYKVPMDNYLAEIGGRPNVPDPDNPPTVVS